MGSHVLKTWSSTQPTVSLSSGEAECYGVVKAAGLALGQQSLFRDLGCELPVRVWTDSSAAIGICSRQGLGKLRHIATHTLWIQEKVREGAIELRKVKGDVNPADLFTKHLLSRERVLNLTTLFGCEFRTGRPSNAPQLRKEKGEVNNVIEHEAHDINVLPHEYAEDDLDQYFPNAAITPAQFEETKLEDEKIEENKIKELIANLAYMKAHPMKMQKVVRKMTS